MMVRQEDLCNTLIERKFATISRRASLESEKHVICAGLII